MLISYSSIKYCTTVCDTKHIVSKSYQLSQLQIN